MRELLRYLAGQGRSVLVSSHLLSEMALMADQLVVIGRGKLIASGPIEDFIKGSSKNHVIIRTPQATDLAELLGDRLSQGVEVSSPEPGVLSVIGLTAQDLGDLCFDAGIRVHELSNRQATLEEAFLEATEHAEEFQAGGGVL